MCFVELLAFIVVLLLFVGSWGHFVTFGCCFVCLVGFHCLFCLILCLCVMLLCLLCALFWVICLFVRGLYYGLLPFELVLTAALHWLDVFDGV